MPECPRCRHSNAMRLVIAGNGEGAIESYACFFCGEVVDATILGNRSEEMKKYWKLKTDPEFERLTLREKNLQEYEPEAIFYSF